MKTTKNETSMELRSDRDVVIARTFNAPAAIVFAAWTKPEFVRRWWAPSSHDVGLVVCDADVRVGGAYRYVMRKHSAPPDGSEDVGFAGEYVEVTPHTKLVYTQIFEPMADAGAVVITVAFDEVDGQTHLTSVERYPSAEARDAAVGAGMEHGMRESMDQLDALVAAQR
ncbi:MAG TPA: SRPBCC family protein [Myxococcota bacterium]